MEFAFQRNINAIKSFLTDPAIFCRSANDSTPSLEDFEPEQKPGLEYVMARDEGEPIAMFAVKAVDKGVAEIHFCFKPSRWGHTQSTCEKFLRWFWKNSHAQVAIGPVPSYNRLALRLARRVGFEQIGLMEKAGTKHGNPFDVIIMGIVRPA